MGALGQDAEDRDRLQTECLESPSFAGPAHETLVEQTNGDKVQ